MPYPESCPECGGTFRNTGTHFTARRNEVGRHVLLELGCQTTSGRFWWDFTAGQMTADGRVARATAREALVTSVAMPSPASNGTHSDSANGHTPVATIEPPAARPVPGATEPPAPTPALGATRPIADAPGPDATTPVAAAPAPGATIEPPDAPPAPVEVEDHVTEPTELGVFTEPTATAPGLKEAFVRQLQLDRLTLRQMRSWLMADDARRSVEIAAGATEATYERLALILFGADLPQLLGKQAPAPPPPSMSAEERLELQREKARIRARLRRAAIKAARQPNS